MTQIIILNTIFSLDSMITAVEIIDHLLIIITAVIIAINLILITNKPLTQFINNHPTIVILYLNFLLIINFNLITKNFNFIIPKNYLYTTINFSMIIETLNQLTIFNRRHFLSTNQTLHQRTTETIIHLLNEQKKNTKLNTETASILINHNNQQIFNPQKQRIIKQILNLNQHTVNNIITSHHDIEHIDLNTPKNEIHQLLKRNQHTQLIITDNDNTKNLLDIIHIIDLLQQSLHNEPLNLQILIHQPLIFPKTLPLLPTLKQFHNTHTHFTFIINKFNSIKKIITLNDITKTITDNLPNKIKKIDTHHNIQKNTNNS